MSLKVVAALILALFLAGCEYVPSKVCEVEATDGTVLKFLCPTVDPHRSTFTYVTDSGCRLIQ